MLQVNQIEYRDGGKTLFYHYDYDTKISKYFNTKETFYVTYNIDVSLVPESIAIIPFLANVMPIAWFAGFSIQVNEVDSEFLDSLEKIKFEFLKMYPNIDLTKSALCYSKKVVNEYLNSKTGMLFTGGVDAYTTFLRYFEQTPDLIKIIHTKLADESTEKLNLETVLNNQESILSKDSKFYVISNLDKFYTNKVNLLLNNVGWWSHVQHGLGLNGVTAPLSFIREWGRIYIGSSYNKELDIVWGSTPEIDNSIFWGKTKVVHDGYELKRQEKVDYIVEITKKLNEHINLRVCYSLLNKEVNCSKCEKCQRTILALILNNVNPNNYGFRVDVSFYDETILFLNKGFNSEGVKYFWSEIRDKINIESSIFIFKNINDENKKINEIKNLIELKIEKGLIVPSTIESFKNRIINTFPNLFKKYLSFRSNWIN